MIFVTTYDNYTEVKSKFDKVLFLNFASEIPEEVNTTDKETYMEDWGIFAPRKSLLNKLKNEEISLFDFFKTYNRDLEKIWPSTNFMLPNLLSQFNDDIVIFCDKGVKKLPEFLVMWFEKKQFKIRTLYAI